MNGYEFESFISKLLSKMGFIVEGTPLSGDNGIDIIAYSNAPMYKGKYIVQCKNWTGTVGEPVIRDLYGVVLSNNANKGILITNSFFTQNALKFAEGKNIELIDGDALNQLIQTYFAANESLPLHDKINFTELESFQKEKYHYLKMLVDTNRGSLDAHIDLFNFLYKYILNKDITIMYSGLIDECVRLCEDIIKKFGVKGYKGKAINHVFIVMKVFLQMLLGDVAISFETLRNQKLLNFNLNDFTENLINDFYFSPSNNRIDCRCIIAKTNLISMLMNCKDQDAAEYLFNKFIDYYTGIIDKAQKDPLVGNDLVNRAITKFEIIKEQIKLILDADEYKIYIPIENYVDEEYWFFSGWKYSSEDIINISEISQYWSNNDYENQRKKIKLLISLDE